jgi:hypothetical protein
MAAPIPESPDASSFSPRRVIERAAQETGADFDFLLQTAARESSFDAGAKARTSSAAGLFQFIEQTWLAMLHRHGEQHGYGELARAVEQGGDGRFTIADAETRQRALDLRFDPEASSVMAGELAAENAAVLRERIGREPTSGELYAAHFLGARGAASLINAAEQSPGQRADALFPAAAAANRPVFFDQGRAVSVAGLLERLTGERAVQAPDQVALSARSEPTSAARAFTLGPSVAGYAAFERGDGVLSPAVVELLASLKAPESGRDRS